MNSRRGRFAISFVSLLAIAYLLGACGSPATNNLLNGDVYREGVEDGGPQLDWDVSPLALATDPATQAALDGLKDTAGYNPIEAKQLSEETLTVYTDGQALAIVLSSPPTWIVQGPLDEEGLKGLQASDPAYADAESYGTTVTNIVLADGTIALQIEGTASNTIIFARADSLIQISAPPDIGVDRLYELAAKVGT